MKYTALPLYFSGSHSFISITPVTNPRNRKRNIPSHFGFKVVDIALEIFALFFGLVVSYLYTALEHYVVSVRKYSLKY